MTPTERQEKERSAIINEICEKLSNPLWEKYIKSFDHIFITKYGWDQMYVGIDCDGSGYSNDLSDFKNPFDVITPRTMVWLVHERKCNITNKNNLI